MNFENLKYGDTGESVKYLQEVLKLKGFFFGEPLGNFLSLTEASVKSFQKANGLFIDGEVGPKTWAKINESTVIRNTPNQWSSHKFHPIVIVPAPYTHLHPYDFICEFALGEKEISGAKHNELIAHFHEHSGNLGTHSDDKNDYSDEVPHCSSGLNWTADGCGCEKTNNAMAFSWNNYVGPKVLKGQKVSKGDIIVLSSSHVTTANRDFVWKDSGSFEGLGFNQGNSIKVSVYNQAAIMTVHKWKPKPGTVLRPIEKQAILGSMVANESTR